MKSVSKLYSDYSQQMLVDASRKIQLVQDQKGTLSEEKHETLYDERNKAFIIFDK